MRNADISMCITGKERDNECGNWEGNKTEGSPEHRGEGEKFEPSDAVVLIGGFKSFSSKTISLAIRVI